MPLSNTKEVQAMQLPIQKLRPFENHPFQVKDDDEMNQLVWSVLTQGVLTPLVVRPLENDEYEVISGHRRLYACQKAGIEMVPALIYALDRDAAAIALVDSNLHREKILPSEKAFAYKLKRDALNHQGKTSPQVGEKLLTVEKIGLDGGDSKNQVLRYIRLTELIPEVLSMVDAGKISLTPAVELSFLSKQEQQDLPACSSNRRKFVSIWKRASTQSRCSANAMRLCQRRLNSFGIPKRTFFDRKVKAISEIGQQLS